VFKRKIGGCQGTEVIFKTLLGGGGRACRVKNNGTGGWNRIILVNGRAKSGKNRTPKGRWWGVAMGDDHEGGEKYAGGMTRSDEKKRACSLSRRPQAS